MSDTDDNNTGIPLSQLLAQSGFLLAYSIPLLLVSVVLAFAGTFLTLDRSRSFAPHYDALPGSYQRPKKVKFILEGGIGGLATGFAFGVHLSTFLALLIPSVSTQKPLASGAFLAVWLLSAILMTFLAGRWRYVALAFSGISGGTLFALAVSVIIHPSLLPRIILTLVIIPITTTMNLLPLARFQHGAVRFSTSSTGAAGLVISIALLANIPAWANVWERYWIHDGIEWGTGKEKGLSAAYCLFLTVGMAVDWLLNRKFGECPDEKWDSYLSKYASNLPDRSGTFHPFTPFWKRAFGAGDDNSKDIIFPPTDSDIKLPPYPGSPEGPKRLTKHQTDLEDSYFRPQPGFLLKGHTKKGGHARFHERRPKRNREGVKFQPLVDGEFSSDSDDSDDEDLKSPTKPWLRQRTSMSSTTPTLVGDDKDDKSSKPDVDYEKDIKKLSDNKSKRVSAGLGEGEVPDYSDYEEDVTSAKKHLHEEDGGKKDWSPGFIKKQQQQRTKQESRAPTTTSSSTAAPALSTPLAAVPATPSLIKALDRIALAQKDAFSSTRSGLPTTTEEAEDEKGAKWDEFWRGVKSTSGKTGSKSS